MQTIERNYRKNPHTARWLMTFHAAAQGQPAEADIRCQSCGEPKGQLAHPCGLQRSQTPADDLLALVPETTDARTPGQVTFMDDLIRDITELSPDLGIAAREWTDKATAHGDYWTPGRDGTTSAWIDRLKAKRQELRLAARQTQPVTPVEIPDGRYAVELDGEVKCYHLSTGKPETKWAGFRFLDRRSSDDTYAIRNAAEKARILEAIVASGIEEAAIRYGLTVKECRRCHRALTDTKNPYYGVALGPDCGGK